MPMTYDRRTCVTAGELRAIGLRIEPSIPDAAWVPRDALVFGAVSCSLDELGDTLNCQVEVSVNAPFRWFSATVDIVLPPESPRCKGCGEVLFPDVRAAGEWKVPPMVCWNAACPAYRVAP